MKYRVRFAVLTTTGTGTSRPQERQIDETVNAKDKAAAVRQVLRNGDWRIRSKRPVHIEDEAGQATTGTIYAGGRVAL